MTIKKIEMVGMRFGRLLVLSESHQENNGAYRYLTHCDCGKEKVIRGSVMRSGATKSCGCIRSELVAKKNYKHGESRSPKYRSMYARLSHMKRKLRMPQWADRDAIKTFYLNKPEGYQVDHIIPLQGKIVSGLHVLENLQYLPAVENNRKQNLYEVE